MNIAFIIFNRPEYTQRVFNEIRKARPKKLFVIADGPRNSTEAFLCESARKIIEQVDWDCEVKKNYSENNLGCKMRVATGLNWFFENVESGIILEDDCLPNQSFFKFSSEMLEKYKDDERIMMVAGSNSLSNFKIEESYLFSQYFAIWGWATWRRAWKKYDIDMKTWPENKANGFLQKIYSEKYMIRHSTDLFDQGFHNKVDTWDTQWFYTCLLAGGYSIVPAINLISNIGIDGTRAPGKNQNLETFDIYEKNKDLVHPNIVEANHLYDHTLYENNYKIKKYFIRSKIVEIKQFLYPVLKKVKILRKIRVWLLKINTYFNGYGICENVNHTHHKKNCLILYITQPFMPNSKNYDHQNIWQTKEIARIIGEFGFNVDVVNFFDKKMRLNKKYDLVLDIHPEPQNIYRNKLNVGAKKIAYITGSNPEFSNKAENGRLEEIYKSKGVKLKKIREVGIFDKNYMESFDSVFLIGNKQTLSTYSNYILPKIQLISNTSYDFLKNSDYSKKSPKDFLFLSGGGQVHKGLHLLLDIFSKNPDLNLYVCSDFKSEPDFCKLYKKELFETPNIYPIGRIDITSEKFKEITDTCSFIVSPSCSEGMSGAVLTGMSAGLIPIVSKESGFNEDEVYILDNCEIYYLTKTIKEFSQKINDWVKENSQKFMQITNEKFSNQNFSQQIRAGIKSVIEE